MHAMPPPCPTHTALPHSFVSDYPFFFSTQFCKTQYRTTSTPFTLRAIDKLPPNRTRSSPLLQLTLNSKEKDALQFLKNALDESDEFQSLSEFNHLLMAFFTARKPDLALKLFSNLSKSSPPASGLIPDSRTFSIVIRCYCKKHNPDEAMRVLYQMLKNGCRPNVGTITVLMNALCKKGRLQKAFEVLEIIGRIGRKPTIQTYNCLFQGLCFVGRVEEALEMFIKIQQEQGMEPDIYTYTALMDGLCKVGRSDEAIQLLNEAREKGLTPSVVTFNTLFNGYCKEGRPLHGVGVLKRMKETGCNPDCINCSTLLHGLLKWGEIRTALNIYKEMVDTCGYEVDERMMNTFLRALCRTSWKKGHLLEHVHQVFDKMKSGGRVIDPSTYELVIEAFCIGKEIDEALANLHHMIARGYSPTMVTFESVIRALCGRGTVQQALLVLLLVVERQRTPSRISYSMLIDEFNLQGNRMAAFHVYAMALKRGVILNMYTEASEIKDSTFPQLVL